MTLRKLKWYLVAYVLLDLLLGYAGIFPLSNLAAAQFTTVTGTVVDPNGFAYANGTIVAVLILPGGTSPTLSGLPYTPPTQPIGLDNTGSFTIQLADNTVLLPAATKWNFTVCSAIGTVQPAGGKGPVCFTLAAPITISGTSQSISSNLNAVALPITNPGAISVANLSTSPLGYFFPVCIFPNFNDASNSNPVVAAGQQVLGFQFVLPFRITVSRISINVTALVAASTVTVGIYSPDGTTKLIDSGTFDGSSTGIKSNTITPVTLNPGAYYFAQSASTQTTLTVASSSNTPTFGNLLNTLTTKRWVIAGNSATAGVLPSSMGTLTTNNAGTNYVLAAFEP